MTTSTIIKCDGPSCYLSIGGGGFIDTGWYILDFFPIRNLATMHQTTTEHHFHSKDCLKEYIANGGLR